MKDAVLGIEIAKRSYQVSLRAGKKIERREFANQPEHFRELSAWLQQHKVKRLQVDGRFEEHLELIQAVPIRGAMHVFRPDQPWQAQADLFLSTVKDKGFHFYTLDLRVSSRDGSTTFLSDAEQWLKYVDERVEQKVLLQTSSIFFTFARSSGEWMKE